jgi:phosphoesterase RecJ-like protein
VLTPAHRLEAATGIAEQLGKATSIAVCTHVGGDGDGWGATCAISHHFGTRADVRLLAATPMPERFRFLLPSGAKLLPPDETGLEALRTADVQVVVDASQPERLGKFEPGYEPDRTIVIDHHAVAARHIEARLELIDPVAASTTELVYDVLLQTGDPLSVDTAQSLYVGLVTDTGSFRYSNSSPHAHRVAAALIEAGVDPEELYRPLFANLTIAELGTLKAAIERLQRDEELGITWSALDRSVAGEFGALDEYEEVIDHLRKLKGTEIAVLLREMNGGEIKISFRSTGAANVAAVARAFGGGGHEKAAGATVAGDLGEITERVLEACRAALREVS